MRRRFSFAEKRQFALDIAMALEYLHSFNVVHRDVKVRFPRGFSLARERTADERDGEAGGLRVRAGDRWAMWRALSAENNKSIQVSFCGSPAM